MAFDLLALAEESLLDVPLGDRRALLVMALSGVTAPLHVAPATTDREVAQQWFEQYEGAGLDGVIAKPLALPYLQDERAMFKIKHERTADVVVAGYRFHKSGPIVGSLLLGLYDDGGTLQHVGVSAAFPMKRRAELVEELEPLRLEDAGQHPWAAWADEAAHETARLPGAPSRWSAKKDLSWVPVRPERVAEVAYDHMENGVRFRRPASAAGAPIAPPRAARTASWRSQWGTTSRRSSDRRTDSQRPALPRCPLPRCPLPRRPLAPRPIGSACARNQNRTGMATDKAISAQSMARNGGARWACDSWRECGAAR